MAIEIRTNANDAELVSNIREYDLSIPIVLNLETDKEYEFNLTVSYKETIYAEEIDGHKEVNRFEIDADLAKCCNPTNFTELEARLSTVLNHLKLKKKVEITGYEEIKSIVGEIIEKVKEFLVKEEIYFRD